MSSLFNQAWTVVSGEFTSSFEPFKSRIQVICDQSTSTEVQIEKCIREQIDNIIDSRFEDAYTDTLNVYGVFNDPDNALLKQQTIDLCKNGVSFETYEDFFSCISQSFQTYYTTLLDQFNTVFDQIISQKYPDRFTQLRQLIANSCFTSQHFDPLATPADQATKLKACINQQLNAKLTDFSTQFNETFANRVQQNINVFDFTPLKSQFFDVCAVGYLVDNTDIDACIDVQIQRILTQQQQQNPLTETFNVIFEQEAKRDHKAYSDALRFIIYQFCITSKGSDVEVDETAIRQCIRAQLDIFNENVDAILRELDIHKDLFNYKTFRNYVLQQCTLGVHGIMSTLDIQKCVNTSIDGFRQWAVSNLKFFTLQSLPIVLYASGGTSAALLLYFLLIFFVRYIVNPGVKYKDVLNARELYGGVFKRIQQAWYGLLINIRDILTPKFPLTSWFVWGLVLIFLAVLVIFILAAITYKQVETLDFDVVLQ